ncbi:hypothetical protein [Microbacterium sp. K35]|uniref:hypothetical protein n=1 Tax=Microbacterium sp. K35 TaxID=2305440 RepID=UPI00109BDFD3|nr:hypothetical protein [Microbacterium sp. K35]
MSADAWEELLDRLEQEAERILAAPDGAVETHELPPWTPPPAPLPAHLADRVRRVIDRQRAAMDRVRHEIDGVRQHLGAVGRVPAPREPDAPAYLDVDG